MRSLSALSALVMAEGAKTTSGSPSPANTSVQDESVPGAAIPSVRHKVHPFLAPTFQDAYEAVRILERSIEMVHCEDNEYKYILLHSQGA